MTVSRLFRSAIVAAMVCTAGTAFAAEPSPADKETARALMTEGRQKRDASDLQAALKAFRGADSIMHVPTTAIEVAKTEAQAGLLLEARDHALTLARSKAQPGEPTPFADARTAAQQLANELEVRIPSVHVILAGAKDDTEVRIDDLAIPSAANGLPRKLNPGSHIVVAKSGGVERRMTFKVQEKESKDVTLDFGQAQVAGVPVDKPPPVVDTPPPPVTPPPTPPDAPSNGNATRMGLEIGGFSFAAVGIIAGSVTGILSLNQTSDLKAQCPGGRCPASLQGNLDSARTLATVSTVGFIAGGAGALVGIIGLILPHTKAEPAVSAPAAAHVEPWIGVGAAGLRGTF
ncbi:MAG TPA: hypothetical protein VF316_04815 [Polyangiaceae bacterium]